MKALGSQCGSSMAVIVCDIEDNSRKRERAFGAHSAFFWRAMKEASASFSSAACSFFDEISGSSDAGCVGFVMAYGECLR